jgi:hypothetical protein
MAIFHLRLPTLCSRQDVKIIKRHLISDWTKLAKPEDKQLKSYGEKRLSPKDKEAD